MQSVEKIVRYINIYHGNMRHDKVLGYNAICTCHLNVTSKPPQCHTAKFTPSNVSHLERPETAVSVEAVTIVIAVLYSWGRCQDVRLSVTWNVPLFLVKMFMVNMVMVRMFLVLVWPISPNKAKHRYMYQKGSDPRLQNGWEISLSVRSSNRWIGTSPNRGIIRNVQQETKSLHPIVSDDCVVIF